jgi:hypothetical protein
MKIGIERDLTFVYSYFPGQRQVNIATEPVMGEQNPTSVEMSDSVIFQTLHDEVVLLNLTEHEYYGLDSVGADVWQLLIKHGNVSDAAKELQSIYDVDEETARRDVETLVKELTASGLLKKSGAGA